MQKNIIALFAGIIFGIGLAISQMINPNKVIGFLDWFGHWDPTLLFVMLGAVTVTFIGYRLSFLLRKPLIEKQFSLPSNTKIDCQLLFGSSLFGIGWGITGYCPGPAIANLTANFYDAGVFIIGLISGFLVTHFISKNKNRFKASAESNIS